MVTYIIQDLVTHEILGRDETLENTDAVKFVVHSDENRSYQAQAHKNVIYMMKKCCTGRSIATYMDILPSEGADISLCLPKYGHKADCPGLCQKCKVTCNDELPSSAVKGIK